MQMFVNRTRNRRVMSLASRRSAALLIALVVVSVCTARGWAQVEMLQAQAVVDQAYRAVLQVRLPHSGRIGSATIISPAGYVLTNYHVIADRTGAATAIELWRQPGRFEPLRHAFNAAFLRGDEDLDLAVLRIVSDADGQPVGSEFAFFPVGDFRALDVKLTDRVDAIGFPAAGGSSLSSYPGSVSGFLAEFDMATFDELPPNPALWTPRHELEFDRVMLSIQAGDAWITTDAAFTRGISGGALLDTNGVLIGVPTLRIRDLRLARPAIDALPLLEGVTGLVIVSDAAPGPDSGRSDLVVAVELRDLERHDSIGGMPFIIGSMVADVARFEELLREHSNAASPPETCEQLAGAAFILERLRQAVIDLRRAQLRTQGYLSEQEAEASLANASREYVSATAQDARFVQLLNTHHGVLTDLASVNGALVGVAARIHGGPPVYHECGFAFDVPNVLEFLVLLSREQHTLDSRLRALRDVTRGER